MFLSKSMNIANIGLYILGLGTLSPLKFSMPFISEITESKLSSQFVSCMRIGVTAGGLLGSLTYESIKHWRY